MSIALVITGGFGNGTLSGDVNAVVTFGYSIGAVADATTITVSGITGGADLTSLSYMVFDAADIGSASIIKQANDETTDSSGDLVVDLTGLSVSLGTVLTIVITNYTTTPTATDRGAVLYGTAA